MNWLKLIPVALEGVAAAVAAFRGKDGDAETRARLDKIRARGAANRSLDKELRARFAEHYLDELDTKREKPPKG